MSKIFDNLFLGNFSDAKNERFLKRNGITHIVTVGVELKPIFPTLYKYLYIPAYDSPGYKLNIYFDQIADFIHNALEEEKGKVFVHCYMGISRSTTSILAYLIKYHKTPPLKGRAFITTKRSIIWPNDGFMRQLANYAKKNGVSESGTKSLKNSTVSNSFPSIRKEESKEPEPVSAITVASNLFSSTTSVGESKSVNKDYYCKNCGIKVFNTENIEHDIKRAVGSLCNIIYLKNLPWTSNSSSPSSKMFCSNTKCNSILGFVDQKGGKCGCGHRLEKVFAVYPLRIINSKAKPKPQKPAPLGALSQTSKAW